MAALLVAQPILASGLEPVLVDATTEDTFANTGREFIEVLNGSASDSEVTITTPKTVSGLAVAERVVDVTAGERRLIGPFPPGVYSVGGVSGGEVSITYEDDAITSITIGVFSL